MKASLPFKYITAVKRGKHYVIFDNRVDEGNRKRKWVGTGLPEKCKKKDLTTKIDELVSEFYKEYIENNIEIAEAYTKAKEAESARAAETAKDGYTFLGFFQMWLEAIKPTVAENTYEGYIHTSHHIITQISIRHSNMQ